jgi:hypothetical protein
MAEPGIQAPESGPEIISGAAIPFRFEISWRSLTRPLEPTKSDGGSPVMRGPARDTEAREWEMVLPRMRRSAAQLGDRRPLDLPGSVAVEKVRTLAQLPAPSLAVPHFATAADHSLPGRWLALAAALLLVALPFAAARWIEPRAKPPDEIALTTERGGAGWMSEWASDPTGSARGRQIWLYRPSISMSDYRLEFLGRIERKSLGWVFRAADSKNYYVVKLEAAQPGSLILTRFAIIRGFEGPHIQRNLALAAKAGAMLPVKLEARGARFTIYLQGHIVEDWEDDRLKAGGVGFLNEREERGQVSSVQISFPTFQKGGVR